MMRINSFVTPAALKTDPVGLSAQESHHLARVLRVEAGQEMTLFDGEGTRADGIVDSVSKKEVTVRITKRETIEPHPVEITLIQAVCKPDRFDMILQKASELGVRTIQPIVTQNTSLPTGKIEKMIGRGEAIIRNASQQCGTAWLPVFQPLEKISAILSSIGTYDALFIGSLQSNAKPFKKALRSLTEAGMSPAPRVALLIGPEGDFTEEEVKTAIHVGAIPVTFGSQILRTETAAIFGLSVLVYELFDKTQGAENTADLI